MKTLEELMKKKEHTKKLIDQIDEFIAYWSRERRKEVDNLASIRAEIAAAEKAAKSFSPPNRITHSDQLRVGMRVNLRFEGKPSLAVVRDTKKYGFQVTLVCEGVPRGVATQYSYDFLSLAAPGSPTIPITEKDNWVERVDYVCGVPGCPFCEPKPDKHLGCPCARCCYA